METLLKVRPEMPRKKKDRPTMSGTDVCAELNISRSTLYRLGNDGLLEWTKSKRARRRAWYRDCVQKLKDEGYGRTCVVAPPQACA